jgi:hypothetical protein
VTAARTADADVFSGGPPQRLQRALGLRSPGDAHVARRAAVAALAGWGPLAVLAALQSLVSPSHSADSFFGDFATYGRSLIAVPALILAEPDCLPWLGRIVRTFVDEGLVTGGDVPRFAAALSSARRWLDAPAVERLTIALAYAIAIGVMLLVPPSEWPAWQHLGQGGRLDLTPAGWWHMLVSLPILLTLFLGWLWRLALWAVFLWRVAQLDLQLVAAHPDQAGGLSFVSMSLQGFRLVSVAMGTVLAGPIANRVVHQGASPFGFRPLVIGLVVSSAILFAGPLTVFIRRLRESRRHAIFTYGCLARDVGAAFEERWLRQGAGDQAALSVPDFSATTDLYAIVANVRDMRWLPFRLTDLVDPVGGAAIPLVPVALLAMPLGDLVDAGMKLLL